MKRWLLRVMMLLFFVLILNGRMSAQEVLPSPPPSDPKTTTTNKDTTTKNPTGAMLRSIVVPGWGQFYNGKWLKGLVIAGAEVGFITNAIVLNKWAHEATTEEEFLYYIDNRNLSFWLLGATILYSMADAYVDAHLFGFDESPDLTLFLRGDSEPIYGMQTCTLTMRLSFHIK